MPGYTSRIIRRPPTSRAFRISLALHGGALAFALALFLFDQLQARRQEPHVFELMLPEAPAADVTRTPLSSREPLPLPEPIRREPLSEPLLQPPPASNPAPSPAPPPRMSADEFFRTHGRPPERQVTRTSPQRRVALPEIEVEAIRDSLRESLAVPTVQARVGALSKARQSQLQRYFASIYAALDAAFQPPSVSSGGDRPPEAIVHFEVSADGHLRHPRLIQSSGIRALDEAALAAFARAQSPGRSPDGEPYTLKITFSTLP